MSKLQIAISALLIAGLGWAFTTPKDKYFEILKNIEIFTNVYKELNTNYVDEIDPGQLMRTGIDAMVGSLDPFTNYISESDIEGFRFVQEGRYHGIGAQQDTIGGYITVTDIYKDQPADQAGLKVGDQIMAIDGQNAVGRSLEELQEIMDGAPGTTMRITVRRPGQSSNIDLSLTRGNVDVPNVPYYGMVSDEVGYISLTIFTQNASRNILNALKELKKNNPSMKGLVLDLRGNGGGLLSEAVNICNIFIPRDEVVVSTRGKIATQDRVYKTMNQPEDTEIPLVILINKTSASASEIVSGVMQDYDRGVLIGQRSYGKGLVQNTMDVGYSAKVKVTTSKYYIPSGRCIQSVEYKNGEPVDIPDDRRAKFQTRNGRTVLDGGGVKPDILTDNPADEGIIKALSSGHFIFNYATQWAAKHERIDSVDVFRFTDFPDFERYLQQQNFTYTSPTEKMLEDLRAAASKEGLSLQNDLNSLAGKINSAQNTRISSYRDILTRLLEQEIAGRYFYQRGKVQIGLRNDPEVQEAVAVIKDGKRYQAILAGK